MDKAHVGIKSSKSAVLIVLDETAPFDQIQAELCDALKAQQTHFFDANCRVKVVGRQLNAYEQAAVLNEIMRRLGEEAFVSFQTQNDMPDGVSSDASKFYMGTVRSGTKLSCGGSLVVVGDVNAGAELVAGENIVVLGSLRGTVHAGVNGSPDAVVIAIDFNPTQVRIGDVISRPLEGETLKREEIEIAYTKNDSIYVDKLSSKKYNKFGFTYGQSL